MVDDETAYRALFRDRDLPGLIAHIETTAASLPTPARLMRHLDRVLVAIWAGDPSEAEARLAGLWPEIGAAGSDGVTQRFAELAETLGRFDLVAAALERSDAAAMRERAAIAAGHAARLAGCGARVIAAGEGCLPYRLLMRWGMAGLAVDGPFTAGVFFGDGVALAVEEDFARFGSFEHYKTTRSRDGQVFALVPKYKSTLNHEMGAHFCDGEMAPLLALYARRIAALRAALQAGPGAILLMDDKQPASAARVIAAFDAMAPGAVSGIVIIDRQDAFADAVIADPRLRVIQAPDPAPGYIWHLPESYNAAAGFDWERRIADSVVEHIERVT